MKDERQEKTTRKTRIKTREDERIEKMKRSREYQDDMCCECGCVVFDFLFKITRPRIISKFQNNRLPIPSTIFRGNFLFV